MIQSSDNNTFYNIIFDKVTLFGDSNIYSGNIASIQLNTTINVLVFINPTDATETGIQQLDRILEACQIAKGDIQIITNPLAWNNIKHDLPKLQNVLLFGVQEKDLGITGNWIQNKIISFDNKTWIKTASISKLQSNNALKSELWNNALKPLFIKT